jgi:uncharacterized protein (TIGR02466 family)
MEKVHQLFSVPLYETHFPVDSSVIDFVKSQEHIRYSYSYMSEGNVLACQEMKNVRDFITAKVEYYFYHICGFDEDVKPELTSSWTNIHIKGDWTLRHSHPNAIVSGVWYLSTTDKTGSFLVHRDRGLFGDTLDFNRKENNYLNADPIYFRPEIGSLYLFPSTMKHSVDANLDTEERISLAFNYMMRGVVNSYNVRMKL